MKINHKARRLCLVAGIAASSSLGCADSTNDGAEEVQALKPAIAALEGAPITPASDSAFSLLVDKGTVVTRNLVPQTPPVRTEGVKFAQKSERPLPAFQAQKLSKSLEERIASLGAAGAEEVQDVLVTFVETSTVPRFRSLIAGQQRDSVENVAALRANEEMVASLIESRRQDYEAKGKALLAEHGAKLGETFWLINGGVVQAPASRIRSLAARADVQYVEPVQTKTPPPANDLANIRAMMNSDVLYNSTGGYIGLLDSGVRSTHERLVGRLSWVRDCVNGTSGNCSTGSGLDPSDNWNHGTSTANALSGLTLTNAAHQGITKVLVDSFKVYTTAGLNSAAAVRGFQATVAGGDNVVVAEIQSFESETGAISTAADACFDAGKIIVAANGNYGPNASTVASPANAHKALGIGNFDQSTGAIAGSSGRGPTADSRIKPDLMGYSIYTAAANSSNTAYQTFSGTSAATPTVAGALQLFRNWTGQSNPGSNYAAAIALGDTAGYVDNNTGAGRWKLPNGFHIYADAVAISQGSSVEVSFPLVSAGDARVKGAIWWPENTTTHNDIDVDLVNPSGVVVSSGTSVGSVFEKVSAAAPAAGYWKLRIRGYSVTGTQTVFYAVSRSNFD